MNLRRKSDNPKKIEFEYWKYFLWKENLFLKKICEICPHHCQLEKGEIGKCRGRFNDGEKITALNYGAMTSIALDPIEKKPLYHFFPGSWILSVGSYGCNLNCPFCQNFEISMADSSFPAKKFLPKSW